MSNSDYKPSQGPTVGQHSAAQHGESAFDYTQHPMGSQNYYGATDTSGYTQQPPSYQDDEALLRSGVPRNSTDEVPDDFKYGGTIGEATIDIRHAFIRRVYAILAIQLIATALISAISFFNDGFKQWIQTNTWMMVLSCIGSFIFLGLTWWKRRSYPMNLMFLAGFTAMEAYTVAIVTSFYDTRIVLEAVIITGALFVMLTLFASQTKYDLMGWQTYLFATLWLVVIVGFVGVFFPWGSMMELVIAWVTALLFSAYIMVDTQMIIRHMHVDEEIAAAMNLYLDIINLFLAILRILNSSED